VFVWVAAPAVPESTAFVPWTVEEELWRPPAMNVISKFCKVWAHPAYVSKINIHAIRMMHHRRHSRAIASDF
jgi:hypothetical protein